MGLLVATATIATSWPLPYPFQDDELSQHPEPQTQRDHLQRLREQPACPRR